MIVGLATLDGQSVSEAVEWLRAQGVQEAIVIAPHQHATAALEQLPPGCPIAGYEAASSCCCA